MSLVNLIKTFGRGGSLEDYMNATEAGATTLPEAVRPSENALLRTPAMSEERGALPMSLSQKLEQTGTLVKLMRNTFRISKHYQRAQRPRKHEGTSELFRDLEALAKDLGVTAMGYTTVEPSDLFADKVAPYPHAIVYAVEMDKARMQQAPSAETLLEVIKAYETNDQVGLGLVDFLRKRGYGAYPGLSIGGMVDYPTLSERAGLGAMGYHGLLISPQDGARLRLSAVFTNITNLPERANEHLWIRDFCDKCRKCIRSCPPGAIYDGPKPKLDGGMSCINADACREYMGKNYTCGVCVKVCPFSNAGYDKIKMGFFKAQAREQTGATPLAMST